MILNHVASLQIITDYSVVNCIPYEFSKTEMENWEERADLQ